MSANLNYPKREATIFDIQINSTTTSHNSIESGTNLFAFQATSDPGRLACLPLSAKGRVSFNDLLHIFISSNPLTDFKFLKYPSDKDILTTTTRAGNVKLFALKDINDEAKSINSPDHQFNTSLGAVESLASHKSVSSFFAVGGERGWAAFDAETNCQEVVGGTANGPIKAIDWNIDGNQIATLQTVDKNRMGTVIDARSNDIILEYEAHNSFGRECRIIHGGKYIISSGFNQTRFQEIVVYDTSAGKVFIRQQYDKSISFLIPAYDEDTKLLFLGAKGSTLIRHVDITNMDVANPNQLNCPSQTIGFCLSPKLKCDVMSAEVQKVYQLHSGGIAPIPCNVIRRSYIEFHDELYPETAGLESGGTVEDWKKCTDKPVKKVNLRPADAPVIGYIGSAQNKVAENTEKMKENGNTKNAHKAENGNTEKSSTFIKSEEHKTEKFEETAKPIIRKIIPKIEEKSVKLREAPPPRPTNASQNASRLYESRSPYYNIKAVTSKSKTITDVRDINSRISSDGTFFTASGKYAAVALNKIEGTVAIYDLNVAGRTPDGSMDAIFNKAPIMDLQFDPFSNTNILCALSTGVIKVWDISEAQYCTNKVPDKVQPEPGMRNVITEENSTHQTISKLTPISEIRYHC
uniref:Coronin-7 n=1 Tax=Panagrolaimus sp. ES5 TaxID=591445 RepID=A0AC34FTJ9_9BILA